MKHWKHNLLVAAAVAMIFGVFSFGIAYLLPSSSTVGVSHWRNTQGSILVSVVYFVAIFSLLILVRFFRKLS